MVEDMVAFVCWNLGQLRGLLGRFGARNVLGLITIKCCVVTRYVKKEEKKRRSVVRCGLIKKGWGTNFLGSVEDG